VLRELGVSERAVQTEREMWILMQASKPTDVAAWIADKREAFGDPEFRALYLATDAAFEWSPDDPRLRALAVRTQRWLGLRRTRSDGVLRTRSIEDEASVRLGRDLNRRVIAGLAAAQIVSEPVSPVADEATSLHSDARRMAIKREQAWTRRPALSRPG
jgi:hypothetical protein